MKKLQIIIVIIAIILISSLSFYLYMKSEENRELEDLYSNVVPTLNTITLPTGYIGEKYNADITSSLIGGNGELTMTTKNLPKGLNLEKCELKNNIGSLEKPNSISICNITGAPEEEGEFSISITIKAKNFYKQTNYTLPLSIYKGSQ